MKIIRSRWKLCGKDLKMPRKRSGAPVCIPAGLHTLTPLLEEKGEGYPALVRVNSGRRKNLESFAGSYTELKHDTVLYAKQVMAEMGGGEIPTGMTKRICGA